MEISLAHPPLSLSELLKRPVVDSEGRPVGKVRDVVVLLRGLYPSVSRLVLLTPEGTERLVGWERLGDLPSDATAPIVLLPGAVLPETIPLLANEMRLAKNILDKKVVDTQGRRVIRVNDLLLEWDNGAYRVSRVEVGVRSLLRRLLPKRVIQWLETRLGRTIARDSVAWEHIEPIETELTRARKQAVFTKLAQLHPADIADIVEELNPSERATVLAALDTETAVEVLTETAPDVQATVMQMLEPTQASAFIKEMEPDEAADLLADLPEGKAHELLQELPPEEAEEVAELLEHHEDTAGGLMTTEFIALPTETTVRQALEKLRGMAEEVETIHYFYVTDPQERLVGVASLRDLLAAQPDQPLAAIMETQLVQVRPEAELREVAETLAKYNLVALPVVSETGQLEGIVTVDDVLDELIPLIWKQRAAKKYL